MQRIGDSLKDKRVLITQSKDFMGPSLCNEFKKYESLVIESDQPLISNTVIENLAEDVGDVDIIIANLVSPVSGNAVFDTTDIEWYNHFRYMVNPLPLLAKKFMPAMIKKNQGKMIVMSSVTALRSTPNAVCQNVGAAYAAARGAQISWVQSAGSEIAKHNVQINAVAQGFIDNPTFYPQIFKEQDSFQNHLALIPANRLGKSEECTALVAFLACDQSNFFAGQTFPVSGGWVT